MIFVVLGAVGTIGGAGLLVAAFRSGQNGEREREGRLFRYAVLGMALGSASFLAALLTAGAT